MTNKKTVTVKLERRDICDLMLACTILNQATAEETTKWARLHEKLETILKEIDGEE